jgi:hypothetical protein
MEGECSDFEGKSIQDITKKSWMESIEQENPSRDGETFDGGHVVFSPVAYLRGGHNVRASGNGNISGGGAHAYYGMDSAVSTGLCIRHCRDGDYAL